jgi:hypothetical protein
MKQCAFLCDFNKISPSKLLKNNIKVKEKFSVVLVHSHHKNAHNIIAKDIIVNQKTSNNSKDDPSNGSEHD